MTESSTDGCDACRVRSDHALHCIDRDDVASFERARVHHAYRAGQALFYEGTPAFAVYCIRSGTVRLTRHSGDRREVVVGLRAAGDLVGFRAVFSHLPYGATAEVIDAAHVCTIPRDVFLDVVRRCPPLALELLRRLALRSRLTEEQLVSRAVEPVGTRVARLLLGLQAGDAEQSGDGLSPGVAPSRDEMALLVGTTRETLSRTLNSFARRDLIELGPAGVRVLDAARLRALIRD